MPRGKWADPPAWFKGKNYAYLTKFDDADWLYELQRCAAKKSPTDLSELEFIGEPGWTKNLIPAYIGLPAVEIVDHADQTEFHKFEKPAIIVIVSLKAPDYIIIKEFKKQLAQARRDTPAPVKTRGSQTAAAKISPMHFNTWILHKIVQLCDLDHWRQELSDAEEKPTDADIARWLWPDYANPRKEIVKARQALDEAIALIPALHAQVAARHS